MSFTGAALAFEKEITAFAERDARRVTPPAADAKPLPLDELLQRVRAARPDLRPGGLVITRDPGAAISLSAGGRGNGGPGGGAAAPSLWVNPYTGEVREATSPRTGEFMRTMRAWHRWLGADDEHRAMARAVTGACNFAFLGLGLTGLYLWWPRNWTRRAVAAVSVFSFKLRGKARDFNWHNSVGLWSAPVIIVLTATALPMSYQWANALLYQLSGSPVPAQGGGGSGGGSGAPGAAPSIEVPKPADGAKPLGYDALVTSVEKANPTWEQITIRLPGGSGSNPGAGRSGNARGGEGRGNRGGEGANGGGGAGAARGGPQAVTVTLKTSDSWPRTATTTLSLDPYTGAELHRDGFGDQTPGRQLRSWSRFLHTGEALGWGGQLIAGLASLGGCVLVYTGFALAWRRFFGKRKDRGTGGSGRRGTSDENRALAGTRP